MSGTKQSVPDALTRPEIEEALAVVSRAIVEGLEDSERLDWLRLHTLNYAQFADYHNLTVATTRKTGTAAEWRDAIDAARKEPTCPKK